MKREDAQIKTLTDAKQNGIDLFVEKRKNLTVAKGQ